MRASLAAVFAALLAALAPAPAAATGALARPLWTVAGETRGDMLLAADEAPAPAEAIPAPAPKKGPSPASAALRSLIVPGWGQLATGHRMQAGVFLGLEAGSWASFITFRRQGALREDAYLETARLYADIDLSGMDAEMRKRVGQYQSNEVYNQYVVRREAAFFITDPDEQAAYIAANSLGGAESWSWTLFEDFLRYRDQRKASESAYHNAEFVVGFAVVNRLVSAVMAARQAASLRRRAADAASVAPDPAPAPGRPEGRFAWGVGPSAAGPLEGRVGWIVSF
jgi:hypothetical protein